MTPNTLKHWLVLGALAALVGTGCADRIDKKKEERFSNQKVRKMLLGYWINKGETLESEIVHLTLFDNEKAYYQFFWKRSTQQIEVMGGQFEVLKSGKRIAITPLTSSCSGLDLDQIKSSGKPNYRDKYAQNPSEHDLDLKPQGGSLTLVNLKSDGVSPANTTRELLRVADEARVNSILDSLEQGCFVDDQKFLPKKDLQPISKETFPLAADPTTADSPPPPNPATDPVAPSATPRSGDGSGN